MRIVSVAVLLLAAGLTAFWLTQRDVQLEQVADGVFPPTLDDKGVVPAPASGEVGPETSRHSITHQSVDVVIYVAGKQAKLADVAHIPWTEEAEQRSARNGGLDPAWLHANGTLLGASESRITIDVSKGPVYVSAEADDSAPGGVVVDGSQPEVILDLPPGKTLSGLVTDVHGRPVSGVSVWTFREAPAVEDEPQDYTFSERISGMMSVESTKTDSAGEFYLEGLGRGPYFLRSWGEGLAAGELQGIRPPLENVKIVVRPGMIVGGRVVDASSGEPVAFATIEAFDCDEANLLLQVPLSGTDGEGNFLIYGLPTDHECLGLAVRAQGYVSRAFRVPDVVAGTRQEMTLRLESTPFTVQGDVRFEDGTPASGATAYVYDPDCNVFVNELRADEAGAFEFPAAKEGRDYTIRFHHPDASAQTVRIVAGENEREQVVLTRGVGVRGRLAGVTLPLTKAEVRLSHEDRWPVRTAERLAEVDLATGEFRHTQLFRGEWVVDVSVEGYAHHRRLVTVLESATPLEIRLEPEVRVRGRVVDAKTGVPILDANVGHADVYVRDTDRVAMGVVGSTVWSGPDGAFEIGGFGREGSGELLVHARGYARTKVVVPPTSGRSAAIEVALQRPATLRVEVDGAEVSSLAVGVNDAGGCHRTVDGAAGVARVTGLLPGTARYLAAVRRTPSSPRIHFEGTVSLEAEAETLVRLPLGEAIGVRGRVVAPANALARVLTVFASEESADLYDRGTRVGPDGSFEVPVSPGRREFTLMSTDVGPRIFARQFVEVDAAGATELEFVLEPAPLRGQVVSASGQPIPIAGVVLWREGEEYAAADLRRASADGDGRFEFFAVAPGAWNYRARAPGFATTFGRWVVVDSERETTHRIELEPEGSLLVETVDPDGAPVAASEVTLKATPPSDGVCLPLEVLEPALRRFDRVGNARYALFARADGHFPADATVEGRAGLAQSLRLVLRPLGVLRVAVKGTGGGAAGAGITVIDEETGTDVADWLARGLVESSTSALATDAEGEVVLGKLPAGRYRVRCGAMERIERVPPRGEGKVTLLLGG